MSLTTQVRTNNVRRLGKLEKLRQHFEQQRTQILANQKFVDSQLQAPGEEAMDDVDYATADVEQTLRVKMRDREISQLRVLDAVLRRMELGQFGECDSCGEEIEEKRLEARPTALLCIGCQEEEEKLQRVRAG